MSRRHKKRHNVEVKELEDFSFAPVKRGSLASSIMGWVLTGSPRQKEAVDELFPLPGNVPNRAKV